jgi:hypothetical protein
MDPNQKVCVIYRQTYEVSLDFVGKFVDFKEFLDVLFDTIFTMAGKNIISVLVCYFVTFTGQL